MPASDYEREPLPYLAGFAAGKAFVRDRRGGGDKRSPMPDFYTGAHAAVAGYRLLTRDPLVPDVLPDHRNHRTSSSRRRNSRLNSCSAISSAT
jgi:predicted nucleic acid-binding protein